MRSIWIRNSLLLTSSIQRAAQLSRRTAAQAVVRVDSPTVTNKLSHSIENVPLGEEKKIISGCVATEVTL